MWAATLGASTSKPPGPNSGLAPLTVVLALPQGSTTANSTPGQQGWFELVRKGIAEKQQEGSAEKARVRAITAQAESLKLRSTMLVKGSPRALIDGQVLREGDYVSGFRVKQIASSSCIVTKDGVDVELRMEP